ncbi:hypothetical protein, partial [Neisseria gonorrhoeae]|uniref:hypothetical protein n=3 Tax=Neisseria gonorrhoeae TaxID=485 RepID=UPI001C570F26
KKIFTDASKADYIGFRAVFQYIAPRLLRVLCVWRVRRREICLLFPRRAGGTGGTLSINRNTVYNDRLFHHIPERNNVSTHGTAHQAPPYVSS